MIHLNDIYRSLLQEQDLGQAMRQMLWFMDKHMLTRSDLFNSVAEEYGLMQDYMLRGYEDAQREQVYQGLYLRLLTALHRMHTDYLVRSAAAFGLMSRLAGRRLEREEVRRQLEGFVQETAMLSLDGDATGEKQRKLYREHYQLLDRLFCSILTSDGWSHDDSSFYGDLLCSPTIDLNDALLLTSAIGLSAATVFDCNKIIALINVYRRSDDTRLRSRALIGWVFALPKHSSPLLPDLEKAVGEVMAEEQCRREVVELQKQLFYCLTAEKDYKYLQQNVIPDLIKDSNFRVTRFGIEEKDVDQMEDILHPDADDKRMERVEKSMRHLIDMQEQGADIYFGGFSKMKNMPFFSTLSNWFAPFSLDHPGMEQVSDFARNSKFLNYILQKGPFCDSDKYSFVLTTAPIVNRLSEQMKEVFNTADNLEEMIRTEDMQSPEYARRAYLQDLYRFFRLNPYRSDFCNPFEVSSDGIHPQMFCLSEYLGLPTDDYVSIGHQLMRMKLYTPLQQLVTGHKDESSAEWNLLLGRFHQKRRDYATAYLYYSRALELQADSEAALRGKAACAFYDGKTRESGESYARLAELHPEDANLQQCLAICELQSDKQEQGLQRLARLNYEQPDSLPIKRSLAWAYLITNQPAKAEPLYDNILAANYQDQNDRLNAAYCKWALRKRFEAVSLLQSTLSGDAPEEERVEKLQKSFADDGDLLSALRLTPLDCKLMVDMTVRGN